MFDPELSDGCTWYDYRINVIAIDCDARNVFCDDLLEARAAKARMRRYGATAVLIYDTVEGVYYV